jgi:hypothetical protein
MERRLLVCSSIVLWSLVASDVAGVAGCDTLTGPGPAGSYTYTSYDTTGVAVVTGWFIMNISDSSTVSGEWHFSPLGTPQGIGPQTGGGKLVGAFRDGKLWIELNPEFRDNNLELAGTLQGNRYAGTWTWLSFIGVTNHGTFEAMQH